MRTWLIRSLVLFFVMLLMSAAAFAGVGIVITIAPPPLPVYDQPICPGDGYFWTPGYWAWGDDFDDYYWVPGTWVLAPEVGFFWTPGYWGWINGSYTWYDGWWGPVVGFYGGINYGFGYFGTGFAGGRWDGGHFFYNTAVWHVNTTVIHNVYETRVENVTVNHVSFNGGSGGINAHATAAEEAAAHDRHIGAIAAQTQHVQEAHNNPQQRASVNQGRPEVAATARPGDFKSGAVRASSAGGEYHPANAGTARGEASANRGGGSAGHVREMSPLEKPAAPNTGNAKLDQKYQKEQDKQYSQQQKARQKLQQQQEKEDQKIAKQNNDAMKQQTEQRHQQQTQQLQQHEQEQNRAMQDRMAPRGGGRPPK
jgi:hypothetical protein